MWTTWNVEKQCLTRRCYDGPGNRVFLRGTKLAASRPMPRVVQTMNASVRSKVISNFSPHDRLGVDENAGLKEIKRAFRKMALKHHPDREGGSEENFILVLEAYEILTGKNPGKTADSNDSWEYHDWFWKFANNRRKARKSGPAWNQTQMKSQLAGLRHRAAVRANKAQQKSYSSEVEDVTDINDLSSNSVDKPEEDFIDSSDAPADSESSSALQSRFNSHQSRAESDTRRRIALNGTRARNSVTNQLAGLRRKANISNETGQSPDWSPS